MGGKTQGWKLLIDEYHLILEDMDFRESAITNMCKTVQCFSHYTFLSATPIDEEPTEEGPLAEDIEIEEESNGFTWIKWDR